MHALRVSHSTVYTPAAVAAAAGIQGMGPSTSMNEVPSYILFLGNIVSLCCKGGYPLLHGPQPVRETSALRQSSSWPLLGMLNYLGLGAVHYLSDALSKPLSSALLRLQIFLCSSTPLRRACQDVSTHWSSLLLVGPLVDPGNKLMGRPNASSEAVVAGPHMHSITCKSLSIVIQPGCRQGCKDDWLHRRSHTAPSGLGLLNHWWPKACSRVSRVCCEFSWMSPPIQRSSLHILVPGMPLQIMSR